MDRQSHKDVGILSVRTGFCLNPLQDTSDNNAEGLTTCSFS